MKVDKEPNCHLWPPQDLVGVMVPYNDALVIQSLLPTMSRLDIYLFEKLVQHLFQKDLGHM